MPSLYEKLPKWIKEKLNGKATQPAPEQEYADSDVPFDDSIPFAFALPVLLGVMIAGQEITVISGML